jgi:nicotinate-nucleotide--dimethylbenzimidazole phosphoribosyltransferase
MIGLGEMGIGNTTAAAATTAALTGLPVASVTGRGTGADDAMLAHKIRVIEQALQLHRPDPADPRDMLAKVGGFELAGLAGVMLAAAAGRKVVVTDGFIATAAAALAVRMCPPSGEYLFAAHRSAEPGHTALLAMIGQEPLLDLRMRLGEGTGAALAFVLIRAAVGAFREMATFASAGVSNRSTRPDAVVS